MAEEKEIKLKLPLSFSIDDFLAVLSKHLSNQNQHSAKMLIQTDRYYDNRDYLYTKNDRGFRIRLVNSIPVDFTFKALFYFPERKPSQWYVEEHSFKLPTKDWKAIREIFERYGIYFSSKGDSEVTIKELDDCFAENQLEPKIIIEKKRRIFHYKDAQIIFDEVKELGNFIEIETKTSSPTQIAKELGLDRVGENTIEGYAALMARKQGLAEMKERKPLYIQNPKWNVFDGEKKVYDELAKQSSK